MTFDEWFVAFFTGMPQVPDHVRWAYQAAYQAGYEQGVLDTEPATEPLAGHEGERDATDERTARGSSG